MSLAQAYVRREEKEVVDVLILSHFDSHGVATASARMRILRQQGQRVRVISRFPETGPQGLSSGQILQLLQPYAPKRIEIIDIPIDVRNPDASIDTLAKLSTMAPVYYFDHHETDIPHLLRLIENGIFAEITDSALSLALVLKLISVDDIEASHLAITGIVADRDPSVLRIVDRQEVEQKYLPIANRLDIIVRQPNLVNASTPGEVSELLAENGLTVIPSNIEYPPESLAKELASKIVREGTISIMVDWSNMEFQQSMWVPKTLEQLLLLHNKYLAIAIVPGYNVRTRTIEGYDVRVLRYWLSSSDVPVPESLVREEIERLAITGNVVGHSDYVSLRFGNISEARRFAEEIYKRVEGEISSTVRLVSDKYVADAVKRDFSVILQRLTEILEEQKRMYQEYLRLKEEQVKLLRRLEEARAD